MPSRDGSRRAKLGGFPRDSEYLASTRPGTSTIISALPMHSPSQFKGTTCRHGVLAVALICAGLACARRNPVPDGTIQAVELIPEERLGIDDVFEVRVLGEQDLSGAYRISADGTIDYPFVGRVLVAGMRSGEVQELLAAKLADGYLKKPQVSVMVKEWNSRKVSVIGQVQKPGSVPYFTKMRWLPEFGATTPNSDAAPIA